MKPFSGYAETKSYSNSEKLPKGGYVLRITGAVVGKYDNGQFVLTDNGDQIHILADIAEGDYKMFFLHDYQAQQEDSKRWRCKYTLWIPKDDGSDQDVWTKRSFKTFTEALEESNAGYTFDWDERKFIGKLIGGLFNLKEWEYNGRTGWASRWKRVCAADLIRNGAYTLPEDEPLQDNSKNNNAVGLSQYPADKDGFMSLPKGEQEELPFM